LSPGGLTMGDKPGLVLLTGGTRGIGRALARAFLATGRAVAATWHADEIAAQGTREEFEPYGLSFSLTRCDAADPAAVRNWVSAVLQAQGPPDCAIHNAGSTLNARLAQTEEADWDAAMALHLGGAKNLVQACLRPMMKAGGQFIFLSSVVATTGNIGQPAYSAAKAAVVGFSRSVAREYGARRVRANVVLPGFHLTRLSEGLAPNALEAIRSRHLLAESTSLEEVAGFFLWLATTQTISGQIFNLDSRLPGYL